MKYHLLQVSESLVLLKIVKRTCVWVLFLLSCRLMTTENDTPLQVLFTFCYGPNGLRSLNTNPIYGLAPLFSWRSILFLGIWNICNLRGIQLLCHHKITKIWIPIHRYLDLFNFGKTLMKIIKNLVIVASSS